MAVTWIGPRGRFWKAPPGECRSMMADSARKDLREECGEDGARVGAG